MKNCKVLYLLQPTLTEDCEVLCNITGEKKNSGSGEHYKL